ncbi:S49 family peptidase [Chloroflexota bacterium]
MGDVAASGGYYISAYADRIVANPSTLTGSIGVISHFIYIEGLLEKLGLELETIKTGKHKDMGIWPLTGEHNAGYY